MERLLRLSAIFTLRKYLTLAKPGIILGNAVNAAAGFALASRGHIDLMLLFTTLFGLSCVIGAGCAFNNYIDREMDEKMNRTRNRVLVKKQVSPKNALIFAAIVGLFGVGLLAALTNLLAAFLALLGLFVYVFLYSLTKTRTTHCTLIGSVAGAIPPVVGYCAVSQQFDLAAWVLFAMLVMWQMPHFFAIAIRRLEDYKAASVPVLPIKKGLKITKIQMTLYVIAFTAVALLLTVFRYTGWGYFAVVTLLGALWLILSLKGFACKNDQAWARQMFIFSLVVVMVLCIVIPMSVL